jgi:hypothetical protein
LADEASLEAVRADMREVIEQVARLRERELALAGGVSQLRAKTARFEEALAGVARVQGKCVARLDGQVDGARKLEHLAARRDDHITRLIRDTAGQRAELERITRELETMKAREKETEPAADVSREVSDVRAKVGQLETQYADLKKLQTGSTQRIIETLESMRDRVGKLELRAAEMSREARAKAGRLDALARHVATVEGRLTTAIGTPADAIVPVAQTSTASCPPQVDWLDAGHDIESAAPRLGPRSGRDGARAGCGMLARRAEKGREAAARHRSGRGHEVLRRRAGDEVRQVQPAPPRRLHGRSGRADVTRLAARLQGRSRRQAFRLSYVAQRPHRLSSKGFIDDGGLLWFSERETFDGDGQVVARQAFEYDDARRSPCLRLRRSIQRPERF